MTVIVITGSTRGIGRGLAESFLDQSAETRVVISGRDAASVQAAVDALAARSSPERVAGQPCDVGEPPQVQALWDAAVARFGRVDLWINNAGQVNRSAPLTELPPEELEAVVRANVLGVLYGSRVAIRGMAAQPGGGRVYNMEGLGSDGRRVPGLVVYGATKYAVRYLTKGLVAEVAGSPVRVGFLSPGMVVTDLLTRGLEALEGAERQRARRIFGILADRVETVTPWLAARLLATDRNGARIDWLTGAKVAARFALAPFRRRDPFV